MSLRERLSLARLPAVASHLICFLLGSLLFEPDSRGKVPSETLVPWSLSRIDGGINPGIAYGLKSAGKTCRLTPQSVRLWQPEEKKIFVQVPRKASSKDLLPLLQNSDVRLYRIEGQALPDCQNASGHATIFP